MASEDRIEIVCPACGADYRVDSARDGKRVRCRRCGEPIRVVSAARSARMANRERVPRFTAPWMYAVRAGAVVAICGLAALARYLFGRPIHPLDVAHEILPVVGVAAMGAGLVIYVVEVVLSYTMPLSNPEGRGSFASTCEFEVEVLAPPVETLSIPMLLGGMISGSGSGGDRNVWTLTDLGWANVALVSGRRYRIRGRRLWTTADTMILVGSHDEIE